MTINLAPFVVVWAAMAVAVVALIVYRQKVASGEDDTLHVLEADVVSRQTVVARKLGKIDKWGKILTVITVLWGLSIAAAFTYRSFIQASTSPLG